MLHLNYHAAKEDTILIYVGYHNIPKQNTTHLDPGTCLLSTSSERDHLTERVQDKCSWEWKFAISFVH